MRGVFSVVNSIKYPAGFAALVVTCMVFPHQINNTMKRNFSVLLALSALVMTAGCKKSLNSSVEVTQKAKAGFPTNNDWQHPSVYGRVIRYDIHDGNGSDCLLAYDISSGQVSLTQVNGTNATTLYSNTGFVTGSGTFNFWQYASLCTDKYNETGGVHIIPYDADGSGYEDHILMYIPVQKMVFILHYNTSTGLWVQDWYNNATGIGGYDLAGTTDKIISYDFGSGVKKDLICYRPGYRIFWVLVNSGTSSSPIWTAKVKSTGGVGGFDLAGTMDQLVALGGPQQGNMSLVATRPSYGYAFVLSHTPNATAWGGLFQSNSGFYSGISQAPFFSEAFLQDRVVAVNGLAFQGSNADNIFTCYRPGSGLGYSYTYAPDYSVSAPPRTLGGSSLYPGLTYPMNNNPYAAGGNGVGDHVIPFSPIVNQGNTSLLFYSNGGGNQAQVYEWNPTAHNYTQVY